MEASITCLLFWLMCGAIAYYIYQGKGRAGNLVGAVGANITSAGRYLHRLRRVAFNGLHLINGAPRYACHFRHHVARFTLW